MDFDDYVAARYGRLIEHAVLSGCPEGEAGSYVDRVLVKQRRAIRRAEDPDPLVQEALERAIRGESSRRRRAGPIAAIATVGLAAAVGVVFTYQPAPGSARMPSLFGYDGNLAVSMLQGRGFDVDIHEIRACDALGVVVGSSPDPGTTIQKGSTVTIETALPVDQTCLPDYQDRVDAWAFVGFAVGGAAPQFADRVQVVTEGTSPHILTLSHDQAIHRAAWGSALGPIGDAAQQVTSLPNQMAELDDSSVVPPAQYCGATRPPQVQGRTALRLRISTRGGDTAQSCPLTVDLYRQGRVIDTVVVYPAGG